MDWSILMATAISIPFKFNEFGQVDTTTNPSKYWKDQIILTLFTRFGERVIRPNFGSQLGSGVFENSDAALEVAVSGIRLAFNEWLSELNLTEISPKFNEEIGSLEISLIYALPSGQSDTITLNSAILNRFGDILEEIPLG
jgi:phage baseplate assembly protein W